MLKYVYYTSKCREGGVKVEHAPQTWVAFILDCWGVHSRH